MPVNCVLAIQAQNLGYCYSTRFEFVGLLFVRSYAEFWNTFKNKLASNEFYQQVLIKDIRLWLSELQTGNQIIRKIR